MDMVIIILCLKIFFIRIFDVSLGTFRTIITVKGKKKLASFIGFIEVFIWFTVVKEALNTDTSSLLIAFAYSLGFAFGTYIGTLLCSRLLQGNLSVQIILSNEDKTIIDELIKNGFGVTVIDVKGKDDKNKFMLFLEITNKQYSSLRNLMKKLDDKAFIVVNETKYVFNGYFDKK